MPAAAQVALKPGRARAFLHHHPWVLEPSIAWIQGNPADGQEVELISEKQQFVGRGIYNSRSRIRVRLYAWREDEPLDAEFWQRRLDRALALRQLIGYDQPDGAARLVFSEADGLSGLVVDRFADYLVVQITALAIAQRLDAILPMLVERVRPRGVLLRSEPAMAKAEGITLAEGVRYGEIPAEPIVLNDGGLRYRVDLAEGQKTGFYLDQRENRRTAAGYLRGRRVLDLFCYTGAFSLAAAAWGEAAECLGFDTSARAVELARENAAANGLSNVRFEAADAFRVLERYAAAGERFGAVILDPPKFTRHRGGLAEALRAYHRINRLAMELVEPGGVLVTCSCTGAVTPTDFFQMLLGAAQQSRRTVQILEQRGASPDHPVAVHVPETQYLKCFIARVE